MTHGNVSGGSRWSLSEGLLSVNCKRPVGHSSGSTATPPPMVTREPPSAYSSIHDGGCEVIQLRSAPPAHLGSIPPARPPRRHRPRSQNPILRPPAGIQSP